MATNIIYGIASYVCHQSGMRSLFINSRQLPLCARCTGIYTGFLVSFVFVWIGKKKRRFTSFDRKVLFLAGLLLILFLFSGFLSFINILHTTNDIRFINGLLGGTSIGVFTFVLLNYSFSVKNYFTGKVLFSLNDFCLLILVILALFFTRFLFNSPFMFYLWAGISFGGLLFTYTGVNLMVVSTFISKQKKGLNLKLTVYTLILLITESMLLVFIR